MKGSRAVPEATQLEALKELVATQTDGLVRRLESSLDALDEAEQGMVTAGMPDEEDAWTKRLRRYEASVRLEYRRALAELLDGRDRAAAAAGGGKGPDPAALGSPSGAEPRPPASVTPRPLTPKACIDFYLVSSLLRHHAIYDIAAGRGEREPTPVLVHPSLSKPGADLRCRLRPTPTPTPAPSTASKAQPAPIKVVAKGGKTVAPTKAVQGSERRDNDADRRKRRVREKAARKAACRRSR